MNIVIIDPVTLVRAGLASSLRGELDLAVVGEVADIGEVVAIAAAVAIDLLISDVWTQTASGLGIVRSLRRDCPSSTIVMLSMVEDPLLIGALLSAGASGYVLKTQPIGEIVAALRSVRSDGHYLPRRFGDRDAVVRQAAELVRRFNGLTKREHEVFELIVRGLSNTEIAVRLFISPRTAETHRHHIIKKLGTESMAEAIRLATCLVSPELVWPATPAATATPASTDRDATTGMWRPVSS